MIARQQRHCGTISKLCLCWPSHPLSSHSQTSAHTRVRVLYWDKKKRTLPSSPCLWSQKNAPSLTETPHEDLQKQPSMLANRRRVAFICSSCRRPVSPTTKKPRPHLQNNSLKGCRHFLIPPQLYCCGSSWGQSQLSEHHFQAQAGSAPPWAAHQPCLCHLAPSSSSSDVVPRLHMSWSETMWSNQVHEY